MKLSKGRKSRNEEKKREEMEEKKEYKKGYNNIVLCHDSQLIAAKPFLWRGKTFMFIFISLELG